MQFNKSNLTNKIHTKCWPVRCILRGIGALAPKGTVHSVSKCKALSSSSGTLRWSEKHSWSAEHTSRSEKRSSVVSWNKPVIIPFPSLKKKKRKNERTHLFWCCGFPRKHFPSWVLQYTCFNINFFYTAGNGCEVGVERSACLLTFTVPPSPTPWIREERGEWKSSELECQEGSGESRVVA